MVRPSDRPYSPPGSPNNAGRCHRKLLVIVPLVAALATVASPVSRAAAHSVFAPPPICNGSNAPCVQQPLTFDSGATTPIHIDMPVMSRETLDANSPYSGEVTFVVTDPGAPPSPYVMRPPYWANPISLAPIDADPNATYIFMTPAGDCTGRYSCTYVTTSFDLRAGWYIAGHAGSPGLVGEPYCLVGPGYDYGCGSTSSESAVYISNGSAKEPPRVNLNATGSGLITKAIAVGKDRYGQAMSLTWDFGDGTAAVAGSFGVVVSHTYATAGDYDVTARVRTADGRNGSNSTEAGILPPKPVLQSFSRVPPPNGGVGAVINAQVQGWPAGASANAFTWSTGCPADPSSINAQNTAVPAGFAVVGADGTIDIAAGAVGPEANAAVIRVQAHVNFGGVATLVERYSDCFTALGTAATAATDLTAGATEIMVESTTVPIGHIAGIGSGADMERRLVTAHGSLIVGALSKPHAAGSPVVDLGVPMAPYVVPGPPADPVAPGGDAGGGGGGGSGGGSGGGGGAPSAAEYVGLNPARLLETRTAAGMTTVDGHGLGAGLQAAGSTTEVQVTGRAGVPDGASAAVLNVTVTEAAGPGYVTVYPCGTPAPTASSLNFATGSTVANGVVAKVGTGGKVCLFTSNGTHLVADVAGYFPAGSSYVGISPARLLETRIDAARTTIDGVGLGAGQQAAGSVTEVQVTGRAGVPGNASAASLNVTVTGPVGPGYVTVYPCGATPPTASSLNFVAGSTIPNGVISKVGAGGKVCLFTSNATDLIVDVAGYFPVGSTFTGITPARLLETRAGLGFSTVDGLGLGAGVQALGSTIEVQVTGRAGVPANASAAILNVTVTEAVGPGYATVYPCGTAAPTASNLNYEAGSTIANGVIAKIGTGGRVCVFVSNGTHVIVDVAGYFPAA